MTSPSKLPQIKLCEFFVLKKSNKEPSMGCNATQQREEMDVKKEPSQVEFPDENHKAK